VLNTGDNFLQQGKAEEKKAELIMNAFSLMRVDLIALGEKEYVFGAPFLRRLATRFSGNFLCANLIDPGQTQSYFLPYLVMRKNGKRILITSILDPAYNNYLRRDKLKITDAERKNILTWIDQVQGIDLLIQGHQPGISRQAEKYKNTTIVINNIRGGQYTAHIDVSWTPANKAVISQPVGANARQTIQDPQIAKLINDYEKWRRRFLQQQAGTRPRPAAPPTGKKSNSSYLGIQTCKGCHPQQLQAWQKTAHSRAIITLLRKQKESDPSCLPCHVTGMNRRDSGGGFISITQTPRMTNVQCEACHGPAGRHAQHPKIRTFKPVTMRTCRRCHTPNTDPEFNFEQDRLKVDHHRRGQPVPETKPRKK